MKGSRLRRLYGATLSWLILARDLPGYSPFLPLIGQRLLGRSKPPTALTETPATLTVAERDWLAAQVRRTPPDAVIVQAGPPEVDVTCALAAGCWASQRHVYSIWPENAVSAAPFRAWHQAVIRHGLAPYVAPILESADVSNRIDLLYSDSIEGWTDWLKSGAVFVQRRDQNSPEVLPSPFDACGTLAASLIKK